MDTENIVQMPTLLERLATKLKTCLNQESHNRQEWIAIQEAKCVTLVEIRDQFKDDDNGFSEWCDLNGFNKKVINHQTRAAAIAMGRQPDALHACLNATTRTSLETIYRFEFEGFTSVRKPPTRRKSEKPRRTKVTREMIDEVHSRLAADAPVRKPEIIEMFGAGEKTVIRAILQAQVERELGYTPAEPLAPTDMAPTMMRGYKAALRKARAELREEITAEVGATYQGMIDQTRERVTRADRIIASHQGLMSRDLFRRIKACLHPDHNTFAFAAEALQAFSELEKVLVKADDTAPIAPGLPKTAAEMMARRRTRP